MSASHDCLPQDMPGENIAQHLADCAEFIDRALSMRCGMVFIASYLGNRSHAHTFIYIYLHISTLSTSRHISTIDK